MAACRTCSGLLANSARSRSLGATRPTVERTSPRQFPVIRSNRSYSNIPSNPSARSRGRNRLLGASFGLVGILGGAYWLSVPDQDLLTPYKFTPLRITSVTTLTPETSLFKVALPKAMLDPTDTGSANAIRSIYVMQPDLQIQRPYTPLGSACFDLDSSTVEVELVVKRYPDGEVSRYLHRLGPGDEIRARGPITTWDYGTNDFDEVIFIVGGTGVTTAVQYLDSLRRQSVGSQPKPNVSVIFASPTPSRVLLKPTLDAFAQQDNVQVTYLVDALDPGMTAAPSDMSVGRLESQQLQHLLDMASSSSNQQSRRKVVVCGPEPMINAVAGPRARDLTQGPVGGILKQLGYHDDEVVKL